MSRHISIPGNPKNLLYRLHRTPGWFCAIARAILAGIAAGYNLVIVWRELAFTNRYLHRTRLPVPVISIGNITTGGTGKTPAVAYLTSEVRRLAGPTPVLVSRGYGADEVKLLHQMLPDVSHFVAGKRVIAGRQAIAAHGTDICLILDDGFQHRYLQRDIDIVLIDATEPFGLGHLLPRGLLREPLSHLRRADIVIITRSDMVEALVLQKIAGQLARWTSAPILKAAHVPIGLRQLHGISRLAPRTLEGKKLLAFAGIGNAAGFTDTLARTGITVAKFRQYPDHHHYSKSDIDSLCRQARRLATDGLITTAKDAIKLGDFTDLSVAIWILDIEFQLIDGRDVLRQLLRQRLPIKKS